MFLRAFLGPLYHTFTQNKGTHTELETGKDNPTHGDEPSKGSVTPSLGKEVFQNQEHLLLI